MNPELLRNLWLELAPRRVALLVGFLVLAFFAAGLPGGFEYGPSVVARWLYYLIVVFWGTRNAALSVVGEIRDRTWDAQRLSSLGAWSMTWSKLFGSTAFNWLGGLLCLAVTLAGIATHEGPLFAVVELVYFVVIGIIAQAVSLLASLVAVRRRQGHSRLEIMIYQLVGLAAAVAVYTVWSTADPTAALMPQLHPVDVVSWWGIAFDSRAFLLASLAIFAAWIFVACYREMRLELKMRNGPFVWLGFLVFLGFYVAGFDAWLGPHGSLTTTDPVVERLALGSATFVILAYAMVILEPKDRVQYRWLAQQLASGRIGAVLWNLQSWMMTYLAAIIVGGAFIALLLREQPSGDAAFFAAAVLGFLTRDVSIFVLVQMLSGRARSDFAAIVVLVVLYALLPAILRGLHIDGALIAFYPRESAPFWLMPVVSWAEALAVVALALTRLYLPEERHAVAARA